MNSFLDAFGRNYINFTGVADRTEYWWYILFYSLVLLTLMVLDIGMGTSNVFIGAGMLTMLFGLISLPPTLAITVRRLHDINKSGWWLLVALVPVLGGFILLFFVSLPSVKFDNRYITDSASRF